MQFLGSIPNPPNAHLQGIVPGTSVLMGSPEDASEMQTVSTSDLGSRDLTFLNQLT